MAEVTYVHMYGHRWVPTRTGFRCVDCSVIDSQLRTEWDWDENMPSCYILRRVNVRGENIVERG